MRKWISEFWTRLACCAGMLTTGHVPHDRPADAECVLRRYQDDMHMEMWRFTKRCGCPSYMVEFSVVCRDGETLDIAFVSDGDAHAMQHLLQDAVRFMDQYPVAKARVECLAECQ